MPTPSPNWRAIALEYPTGVPGLRARSVYCYSTDYGARYCSATVQRWGWFLHNEAWWDDAREETEAERELRESYTDAGGEDDLLECASRVDAYPHVAFGPIDPNDVEYPDGEHERHEWDHVREYWQSNWPAVP